MLKHAHAYAVFPSVGKASLVIGGSYGRGAVFERGKFIGYATIGQTTIGVQIGGDTFAELIIFDDKRSLDNLKRGKMAFAADASAVLVKAGAAAARGFGRGTRAFVYGEGGMLLEAAIGGQKFKFKPAGRGQDEEEESGNNKQRGNEEQSGAGSTVRSAASGAMDFIKEHPAIATVAGVGAAGIALLIVRKLRSSVAMSDSQDDESQSDEDSDQQMSGDQGEDDQQDDQDDQQEDSQDDESESSGNGRSRFAGAGRNSR